jgi:hypothetical protein
LERKSAKRKQLSHHLRRKYKRYAAALAGAAIMTGAALPGIPVAFAAESPSVPSSSATNYTAQLDKDTQTSVKKVYAERNRHEDRSRYEDRSRSYDRGYDRGGWHQHQHSWPSSDENQAWYQDGRIYYRSDSNHYRSDYAYSVSNPIDVVKNAASLYGFNRYTDSFTLLTRTSNRAVVEVIKKDTGKIFNMVLERSGNNDWRVVGTLAR